MLEKIISGGQSGADRGGLDAARIFHIPTGGWVPKGWRTEKGPSLELRDIFGLQETPSSGYLQRTEWNVRDADATIILSKNFESKGTQATQTFCDKHCKNFLLVPSMGYPINIPGDVILDWLVDQNSKYLHTLNIAGNRESVAPGIERWVTRVFIYVFTVMKEKGLLIENH